MLTSMNANTLTTQGPENVRRGGRKRKSRSSTKSLKKKSLKNKSLKKKRKSYKKSAKSYKKKKNYKSRKIKRSKRRTLYTGAGGAGGILTNIAAGRNAALRNMGAAADAIRTYVGWDPIRPSRAVREVMRLGSADCARLVLPEWPQANSTEHMMLEEIALGYLENGGGLHEFIKEARHRSQLGLRDFGEFNQYHGPRPGPPPRRGRSCTSGGPRPRGSACCREGGAGEASREVRLCASTATPRCNTLGERRNKHRYDYDYESR